MQFGRFMQPSWPEPDPKHQGGILGILGILDEMLEQIEFAKDVIPAFRIAGDNPATSSETSGGYSAQRVYGDI